MADLRLVVGNLTLSAGDQALSDHLTATRGDTVTTALHSAAEVTSGHDCIIISESCSSATLAAKYLLSPMPVLHMEGFAYDDSSAGTGRRWATSNPSTTTTKTSFRYQDDSEVAWTGETVGTDVTVATGTPLTGRTNSSAFGAGFVKMVQFSSVTTAAVAGVYPDGSTLAGGDAAANRYVALLWGADMANNWNTAGIQLFDDLLDWAIGTVSGQTVVMNAIDVAPTAPQPTVAQFEISMKALPVAPTIPASHVAPGPAAVVMTPATTAPTAPPPGVIGGVGSAPAAPVTRTTPEYTVVAQNLVTGQRLGEIPASTATYTEVLNAPGSATLVANISALTFQIRSAQTTIWILEDGDPVWSGIVWSRHRDPLAGTVTIIAKGWHSYLRHRIIKSDLSFADVDQADIVRGLVDHAQGVSGGNVGIDTTGTNLTGRTRTRDYLGRERQHYATLIEQLAAVEDGFDFAYRPYISSSGQFAARFEVSYPPTGPITAHVFEEGSNCTAISIEESAETMANSTDATGAGEGTNLLIASVSDPNALGSYPLLDHVSPHASVTVVATLLEHATRELLRRGDVELMATIEISPGALPSPDQYAVGDQVRWIFSDNADTYDRLVRIGARTVDTIANKITLTLVALDPVNTYPSDDHSNHRETQRRLEELERARQATP